MREEKRKVVIKYPRDRSLSSAELLLQAENLASLLYRFFKGGTYTFTTETIRGGGILRAYLTAPIGVTSTYMGDVYIGRSYVTMTLYLKP